ncbi:meiosis protein SPO22/ZIP4 like-domain-containing protein [Coniella lustricola]|uniref:Meiosis protein SPO22/ZIP4 like-domain-containing protein n=1 Tax=Coniella lustricola TaxID=2025994 RepID=A0A2T3AGI9_9PEZI|nr:meiosis protein SPO22/ZIP4 like-domain-containing protein [Coniella lustricola]
MRIALKACICCTDHDDVQTARLVLQRAADYHGRLQHLSQMPRHDQGDEILRLEAEWTALRIILAFQDDQLIVAEHTFISATKLLSRIDAVSVERFAESIVRIGKGLLSKRDYPMAETWLQRAWELINGQQLENMSRDAVESRMAILQSLVTALMGLDTNESVRKAQNLVKCVESEVGDELVVLLLNLEILNKASAETFDGESYSNVIRRMIHGFKPTEANFKLVAHHIRILHIKCPSIGCSVANDFICSLVRSGRQEWIDKAVITRIHMATSQRDFEGTVDEVFRSLTRLKQPLSTDASFAAQTLIWKKVDSNYQHAQFALAERWSHLGLSEAFANSGPNNRAKLERKLLLCAIDRNDPETARSVFLSMSPEIQKEPMTHYLLYRATIRSGDIEMAVTCLDHLAKSSIGLDLLSACVADSQYVGHKIAIVEAMKKLVQVYDYGCHEEVHLPALLRCTIMLMYGLLKNDENNDQQAIVADLCDLFSEVVAAVQKAPKDIEGNRLFDMKELEWFCQNAYNLGLRHAGDWALRNVVQILTACVSLIDHFPNDIPDEMTSDLSLRLIFCNFFVASALVALARADDNVDQQLQDYLIARKHIAAVDGEVEMRLQSESLDEVSAQDLKLKLAQLLAFDFEAAVALKRYSELSEIVLKASQCREVGALKAMADCTLRNHLTHEDMFSVLRKIINQILDIGDHDSRQLAKYTRCLFQMTFSYSEELGGRLLEETCQMVTDAHGSPATWPSEEVEWFASSAYNHAIDLYNRKDVEACRRWAQSALKLAHYSGDGGTLEALLQERYVKLGLEAA